MAAVCLFAFGGGDGFFLSHFQERDIARAESLLSGHFDPYGPETNFGPRLPGSFYAALLSLPLFLTGSWESVAAFLSLLVSLSVAAAATYVRSKSGLIASLLFATGLALSPVILQELLRNWNPSFGIVMALLVNLAGACALSRPESRIRWALLGALISLGFQVHGTFLAFYPAAIWCLMAWPGKRAEGQAQATLAFLAGAFLPFLPLALAAAETPAAVPSSPVGDALKYFVSLLPMKANLDWRLTIAVVPPLLPLLASWAGPSSAGEGAPAGRIAARRMALCQLPAAGSYLWSGYGERYALCFVVSLAFWAALSGGAVTRRFIPLAAIVLAAALVFLLRIQSGFSPFRPELHAYWLPAISLALAIGGALLAPHRHLAVALFVASALPFTGGARKDSHGRMLTIAELKTISAEAVRITGWSYEEFRWKTIALGLHKDVGFELPYRQALAQMPKGTQTERLPSGLFLVARSPIKERGSSPGESAIKRIHASLGDFFAKVEIAEDSATCIDGRTICLIPYYANQPDFPELVHNLGTTLLREKVPFGEELQRAPQSPSALLPLSGTAAIFAWSTCGQAVPNCRVGIAVEAHREGSVVYLRSTIVGESLSLTSYLLSPKWTETWHHPFVGLVCGKGEERKELLPVIGNTDGYLRQIMAPFRRTLAFRCPVGKAASIVAGRSEYSTHSGRKFHNLDKRPGGAQYWRLPSPL